MNGAPVHKCLTHLRKEMNYEKQFRQIKIKCINWIRWATSNLLDRDCNMVDSSIRLKKIKGEKNGRTTNLKS